MDKDTERIIQHEGAAALLDRGVSVPLKDIHVPFIKSRLSSVLPCADHVWEV